ncbi:hypothetical protein LCI18_009498 [Fusarium solani-melongenae]|uniref:Uncharacterized protein n=1 Tax=Fusarium solani subsp. cucurbitae TaxID=2747967 RepID=A0ACD3ZBX0_FUSSC|nr:hypothetical protein LCI18_009498 [Fusarium solani-melongenae]
MPLRPSFLEQENDHTPVSSNRFEDAAAAQAEDGFVVPDGLVNGRDNAPETTADRNARVAWTAPQNRLVDDATRRLQFSSPDKKVVRILPWPVEMKNLRRVDDTAPQRTDASILPNTSPASRQMTGHIDSISMEIGLHELDPKRLQQASPGDDGDPPDTYELKVGHSYANDISARYITQMLVDIYRSETLMDARDAKLMESAYDLLLRGMGVAEIPKDMVDVRTVDDSPSHKADIVIIDYVRVSRLGFVGNAHRMAVMMTRARVGIIIVGPGAKVIDSTAFADLRAYINDHHSVINLSSEKSSHWDHFCDNCIQPGHEADRCPKSPPCRTCNGATHSTRACPRASENAISIWMADKIMANDGIERSIGPSVVAKLSGKRVKKN